ncbi:MAG TPA: 4'-phosphopantetheinyl transferase superfamily protein [Bryobacteraceae bacterium]|nr:4'-phosphopantetheinyl transferase superfamily protein [Bryobacteraceae bacterium]
MEVYWLVQDAGGVPEDDAWLGVRERAVLASLRIAKRRSDWRLGRWTAKLAIAAYRRLPPRTEALAAIEVRPAPSGAPAAFFRGQPAGLTMSLSHSHGVGFCVLGGNGTELGCDVERVELRSLAFLQDFFSGEEVELVLRSPAEERDRMTTLIWSAKESTLKAIGCGLRSDTRAALVNFEPGWRDGGWSALRVRYSGRIFQGWRRQRGDFVFTMVANPAVKRPAALYGLVGIV